MVFMACLSWGLCWALASGTSSLQEYSSIIPIYDLNGNFGINLRQCFVKSGSLVLRELGGIASVLDIEIDLLGRIVGEILDPLRSLAVKDFTQACEVVPQVVVLPPRRPSCPAPSA